MGRTQQNELCGETLNWLTPFSMIDLRHLREKTGEIKLRRKSSYGDN